MKVCSHKRSVLLAFGVVLGGLTLFCFLWVRKEQRQYALNRQLIVTLMKEDTKQALALVNDGADPNTRLEPLPSPTLLQLATQLLRRSPSPFNESPTALMLVCGARFKAHTGRGAGPWQAVDEDLPLLQAMLLHGTNIDVRASQPLFSFHSRAIRNYTALHYAARMQYEGTMELLLQHGAKPNVQDITGRTPLMLAAPYDTVPMIRVLFAHGAKPNVQDNVGMTALAIAVASLYPKSPIAELLVHGADPNLCNDSGDTPLMAVHKPRLAALLLQYGADINARDKDGRSVLFHVKHYSDNSDREPSEYKDIVAFLKKHGARE